MPHLDNPHALWLLLLVPVYLLIRRRRLTTAAVRYPSVRNLKRLPSSLRQRCRVLQPILQASGFILLIFVLARPILPLEINELPSEGIAIAMLIDRSGSMGAPENKIEYDGESRLRMDVAKDVSRKFIEGDKKDLKGRPNDLIGLFTFATYPMTDHPFGLEHSSVVDGIDGMSFELPFLDPSGKPTSDPRQAAPLTDERGRQLYYPNGMPAVRSNPMQFTDLKKAIEYTADKMRLLEQDLKRDSEGMQSYHLKSKVMVLLTDGEPTVAKANQKGQYPDEFTLKKLTDAGIRVYFIQILSHQRFRERPDGTVEMIQRRRDLFGRPIISTEERVINEAIENARTLARRTGGEHFLGTSGDQIKEIYKKIDEMETVELSGRTVFSREERYRPWLLAALALLAGEALLSVTWLRRAP